MIGYCRHVSVSFISYCPWWIFSVLKKNFEFWDGTHNKESDHQVQTTQHHWRQLFPQIPPLRCTCQLMSLTSLVQQQQLLFKRIPFVWCCLFRPDREGYIMPCFGSFHKKMSAMLSRSFVCSLFYLPYCSYKTYRWVDECIVLLLLTCLRLYEFAVSMFGGGERDGEKTWFKKRKRLDQCSIPCNLCNCWL